MHSTLRYGPWSRHGSIHLLSVRCTQGRSSASGNLALSQHANATTQAETRVQASMACPGKTRLFTTATAIQIHIAAVACVQHMLGHKAAQQQNVQRHVDVPVAIGS